MLTKEEIVHAIGLHVYWEHEFAQAINDGRYWVHPEIIECDIECALGHWLYGLSSVEQSSEHFKLVQALHATFHQEAARVMRLALAGEIAAAQTSLGVGLHNNLSTALLIAMREWMNTIESPCPAAGKVVSTHGIRTPLNPTDPKRSQPGANF